VQQGTAQRDLVGPFPAPVGRIQGRYRWQVLVKSDGPLQSLNALPAVDGEVQVTIDLDPLHML
jgi:primosomal protein N'